MITISETITENIFRDFYNNDKFIEKSAIPKSYGFISKNKTENPGYPDFFQMIPKEISQLLQKQKH